MTRSFTPVLFLLTTGYVGWYNASHANRKLVFPFVEHIPGVGPGMDELGQATLAILLGITVLTGISALRRGGYRTVAVHDED